MGQPLYGNTISRFHLIVHYVNGGEFITGNYIPWQPPHSGVISDALATTAVVHLCTEFELCGYIRSADVKDCQSSNWWLCASDPWPFESQINGVRHIVEDYYCVKFQVIPIRRFRFIMLTFTPAYIVHIPRDKVVANLHSPTPFMRDAGGLVGRQKRHMPEQFPLRNPHRFSFVDLWGTRINLA